MDYLLGLQQSIQSQGAHSKDLYVRATGRFYTPAIIGKELARNLLPLLSGAANRPLRVIDPFCGDGRLIRWLLEATATTEFTWPLELHLWDCDHEAVQVAADTARATAELLGVPVRVFPRVADTFEVVKDEFGTFDAVITNPPWEVLKPDRREMVALGASASGYVAQLRRRDTALARHYPISQPAHKFSGWGTNLARVGTEIALRLCRQGAVCGIVSPASLFGDQVSRRLREWLFTNFSLSQISFFAAEGRFFEGVDQPVVAFTMLAATAGPKQAKLDVFNKDGHKTSSARLNMANSALESQHWTIPLQFGLDAIEVLQSIQSLPSFAGLERSNLLWAGRELDETGRKRYLGARGELRFAKGVLVGRYSLDRTSPVYVKPGAVVVPKSAYETRVAWRDVSRPNQKRRMHATIMPRKWVTGNSLHVAFFKDRDNDKLSALLLVLNSLIFEIQVRAILATAHMSLGVVRQSRIPDLSDRTTVRHLAALAKECLRGREAATLRAEIAAAQAFGLGRSSFERVVASFPKITDRERDALLKPAMWK